MVMLSCCGDDVVEALLAVVGRRRAGGALELDDDALLALEVLERPFGDAAALVDEVRAEEGDVVAPGRRRRSDRPSGRPGRSGCRRPWPSSRPGSAASPRAAAGRARRCPGRSCESTSATCLAAEPAASVTIRSQPQVSAVSWKDLVSAMRQGLLLSIWREADLVAVLLLQRRQVLGRRVATSDRPTPPRSRSSAGVLVHRVSSCCRGDVGSRAAVDRACRRPRRSAVPRRE